MIRPKFLTPYHHQVSDPVSYAGAAGQDLRPVAVWLFVCAGFIYAMALIGAITRLTESGLSMVEWRPLIDIIPPRTPAAWQRVFSLYEASPEYRYVHVGMTLEQFKHIYFWEWLHRLWGQLIESVFLLPFLWFYFKERIPRWLLPRLLGMFALGGVQGIIGWIMVQSGLVDEPHVSHYRLALHLCMALLIYALALTTALRLLGLRGRAQGVPASLRWHMRLGFLVLGTTIVWGAFVAGLHAGLAYNTFPLMDGRLVPEAIDTLTPWWKNALENTAGVQFIHRMLAMTSFGVISWLGFRLIRHGREMAQPSMSRAGRWIILGVILQVSLGISTLLLQVPVWLGVAHQAGAILVLSLLLVARTTVISFGGYAAFTAPAAS